MYYDTCTNILSAWMHTKAEDNKETPESHDFSRHSEDTTFALQNTQVRLMLLLYT